MSPQIIRIEDAGPDRKARRLVFDDGSDSRLTSAAAVKSLGLEVGVEMSSEVLELALAEVEPGLAKDRALRLLGYRERSRDELLAKLRDSGYPVSIAEQVASRFEELGLVDDVRFAEMWARSRKASGFGARRIERELIQRGVEPEVAVRAVSAAIGEDDEVARARAALRGRTAGDRGQRDRLIRRLVGKGFDLSVARQAVESSAEFE